ncbi:MAG: hypothetical protein QOH05_204 [Acetobacteraceae bacterium]|nr:hypothetical protein [Acetobacteraceae bacterium]
MADAVQRTKAPLVELVAASATAEPVVTLSGALAGSTSLGCILANYGRVGP